MMYSEFVEGTGCRDNEHNYKVFQNLEVMYMNSDMSKAEIYEYGKKLVDNSKSEKQLAFEAEIKAEIAQLKEEIKGNKSWIEYKESMKAIYEMDGDKESVKDCRRIIKLCKEENKKYRARIKNLEWVLA